MYLVNEEVLFKETMLIMYLFFIIYSMLQFGDSIVNSVYNCMLTMLIVSVAQMIMYIPASLLIYKFIKNENFMALFINIAVLIFVFFSQKSKLYKILHNIIVDKEKRGMVCILVNGLILAYYLYKFKKDNFIMTDAYLTGGLLFVIVIFAIYRWQQSTYEVKLKQKQLEMTRIYNDSFKSLIDVVRKNQHDFNNHLLALSALENEENNEKIKQRKNEYKNRISEENKYNSILYRINEPIIAGFLFGKLKETENMGVETTYDVNLCTGEFKYISVYDFIEILGILIDNARDAILSNKTTQNNWENIKDNNDCEKKENITIKIAETEKKVIVEVSNPNPYCTEDEIIKMFEKGYSTKGEDRGIGLNKIKEYQDKYKFDILVENIMTKIGNTIKFSVIIEK
ncbi:GHKL domain-containing protein [uncultured Eubacterium sp.]|uniref:sensor histidine kinase n=1 Tax=uncultured Eubacterium sp. TaxID=165185 RepID=UPI003263E905